MSKEKVEVVIDSNEASQNPELTEVMILHEDIEDYKIEPLSEGDIHIEDCIFERKTPSDFASSLQEGRLKEQVERMGSRKEQSFLLIEGDMMDFNSLSNTQIPAKSLRGMVASIAARNRIQVIFCSSPEYLADTAVRIARKVKEEPTTIQTKSTETIREPSFMENLFLGVDGIGIQTAENLCHEFSTLHSLNEAEATDFTEVDGIGEKTAEKIYSAIKDDYEKESESEVETETEVYSV